MMFTRTPATLRQFAQRALPLVAALALAACAGVEDDTTGSRLAQPAAGSPPRTPTEANDIAIVGQEAAKAIMDLPAVADATTPPLVRFSGVTSIVSGPVPLDTEPYTELLRDRLLLVTREKLRFVERTLPKLVIAPAKKSKSKKQAAATTVEDPSDPEYQILAELRGRYDDDLYRVQVQFIDIHSGEVLFDGLYRIRKESGTGSVDDSAPPSVPEPPAPEPRPPSEVGPQ